MLLSKSLELTTKQVEFDRAIRQEGILLWKELELHRERIKEMWLYIQKLRIEVNSLLSEFKKL